MVLNGFDRFGKRSSPNQMVLRKRHGLSAVCPVFKQTYDINEVESRRKIKILFPAIRTSSRKLNSHMSFGCLRNNDSGVATGH